MKATTSISVFAAGLLAVGNAATYDVVAEWDAVSSANYRDGTADLSTANGWTLPSDDGVGVSNRVINVNLSDSDESLIYTAKTPTTTNTFETVYVSLTGVVSDGFFTPSDIQAGLTAVSDDTAHWYGWCGGDNAGWRQLTGATPSDEACVVRTEFDNSGDTKRVRYAVKQGTADFVVLTTADGEAWLTNGLASVKRVNRIGFGGTAAFTNIVLTQTGTMTVEDDSKIAQRMEKQGIAASELNKVATNGNSNWENLVLGLDGQTATSKPVVLPVQSSDASTVTLKLGGVDVDTTSGATVKYKVWTGTTPGGHEDGATDLVAYGDSKSVTLPESGVKYYTMEVVTSPASK